MAIIPSGTQRLVVDPTIGNDLRASLARDPQGGTRQAARQFEALLLNMMLKSMRDASPSSGLLDSDQSQFFSAMGDQQLAMNLAAQSPLGLAALIEKQIGRQAASAAAPLGTRGKALPATLAALPVTTMSTANHSTRRLSASESRPLSETSTPGNVATTAAGNERPTSKARAFVDRVWPHALEAAATLGVPAHFLVAQSALESAWGKSEIRGSNGAPSFNLFGIKAGGNWTGATVDIPTTEYINGAAQTVRAKFRAYASYAEAFRDYANLLASRPRFAAVLGQQDGTQFARSLQQAGYATDPMYADKLARIINGPLLRQALTG